MHNPYYDVTVPVFKKMLESVDHLLSKGLAYATEKGISEQAMLENRLAPDMFPLLRQVQIASDNAKAATARLCGIEAPVFEDTETTIDELHERIAKTIAFLDTITPAHFSETDTRKIEMRYYPDKQFTAQGYLTQYALPNFFFHVNITYALLRAMGADIGKADYIGPLQFA